MIRVSETASANCCGSREKPGASTSITCGVKISASASSTTCDASSSVKMRSPKQARRSRPALGADPRIGRNEGGVERALGENGAEMVGQPEGDEERVGDRPGADNGREHDVAHEAGQARQQRVAADGENLPDHWRLVITIRSSPRKRGPRLIGTLDSRLRGNNVARLNASARRTAPMMRSWTGGSR